MNRYLIKFFQIVIALIVVYFLWKGVIWIYHYPTYILPAPSLVSQKLVYLIQSGKIYPHLQITLTEIFAGFLFGSILAMFFGYIFAKKRILHLTITPYIVAFQSIPIVALAPIFIIWFGSGITSKIVICSIIVFFPVMVNTITAISNIEETKKELMCTLNSSFLDNLLRLEIPHSLPYIFSSMKIGMVLAIVGAIVGEFMGADKGLGFLINSSLGLFDTPQLFAVIFILALLGIILYTISSSLESFFIKRGQKI